MDQWCDVLTSMQSNDLRITIRSSRAAIRTDVGLPFNGWTSGSRAENQRRALQLRDDGRQFSSGVGTDVLDGYVSDWKTGPGAGAEAPTPFAVRRQLAQPALTKG